MNQSKWILISLGLMAAASVGMVACGDDEKAECTTDADCGSDEVCSTATGVCEVACTTAGEECDDEADEICSDVCPQAQSYCFRPCFADGDCDEGVEHCDLTFCGTRGGQCVPNRGCTTDTDCTNGQICEPTPGETTSSCVDRCTADTDCPVAGSACNTTTGRCIAIGAACTTDDDCGTGNVCTANVCEPAPSDTCDDQQTCYDRGNEFCASTPTGTNACADTSCGVSFNSCSRCILGPNGGDRDTDGPQIFAASQNDLDTGNARFCKNDLSQCDNPSAPIVCEFQFFAFSPNAADLPTTSLNKSVFVINSKGVASNPFGVKRGTSGGLDTFSFRACFPEGQSQSVGTAAYLVSASGKKSNTLCTVGSK